MQFGNDPSVLTINGGMVTTPSLTALTPASATVQGKTYSGSNPGVREKLTRSQERIPPTSVPRMPPMSPIMHASVTGTANGATQEAQERVCEVIRFLAERGAPVDEKNAAGRTPIDLADGLPIDKAVDLFTELILKSGAKPKSPSKR